MLIWHTALVIPAAYHSVKAGTGNFFSGQDLAGELADMDPAGQNGLLFISRGTAILLLGMYVAYLYFQVNRSSDLHCLEIY